MQRAVPLLSEKLGVELNVGLQVFLVLPIIASTTIGRSFIVDVDWGQK